MEKVQLTMQILAYKQVLKNQIFVMGFYCILQFFVGWVQTAIFLFSSLFSILVFMAGLHIDHTSQQKLEQDT